MIRWNVNFHLWASKHKTHIHVFSLYPDNLNIWVYYYRFCLKKKQCHVQLNVLLAISF